MLRMYRKYGMPQDGQEQGQLESRFESLHGTQQLRAMVTLLDKLMYKGDPYVHVMEVEQAGEINNCDDAAMAKLVLFSLDTGSARPSRLTAKLWFDPKDPQITEEMVVRQLSLVFRHSQGDEGPPKGDQ
eukprot:g40180.t1